MLHRGSISSERIPDALISDCAPLNSSLHRLTRRAVLALVPTAEPVHLRHPFRNTLAAPVRSGHGPQRHKGRRVLPREPDAPLRTAFPQRLNVLVQPHLPVPCRIAGLERRVRAEACEFVVLPVRGDDRGRVAIGRRGGIVGQTRVVGVEEGVEPREVFLGGWIEALDQRGDVLSTGSMEVE